MKDANLTSYDGQSDISDQVIQSSVDEINEYDPGFEDKFRVDRKKLESMLQSSVGGNESENAEQFFQRIMDETNTVITWPSKLKIGAKSKKDPHIKVTGRPENIRDAKMKVKEVLDTKTDRVTLKMDISYTDHSHLIGKGGSNIQKVMEETKCHIHFPDSNRNNTSEKSNHVSVAGPIEGIEQARACIRRMLPLVFTFECPDNGLEVQSMFILNIQQRYNVIVSFRQQQLPRQCVVRGSESWADNVKTATLILMEHLVGNTRNFVPVTMTMEITSQHCMKVKENCDSYSIAENTKTVITFSNVRGTLIKSTVTVSITGHLEGVHQARKQLMGGLPLVLLFDLREGQAVDDDKIARLMQKFDVSIHVQQKQKTAITGVSVKGYERQAETIYEVRRILLELCPNETANVPKSSGTLPSSSINGYADYLRQNLDMFGQNTLGYNGINAGYRGGLPSPNLPLNPGSGIATGGWNTSSNCAGFYPVYSYVPNHVTGQPPAIDAWHSWTAIHDDSGIFSAPSSTTSSLSSPAHSPRHGSPVDVLQQIKYGNVRGPSGITSSKTTIRSTQDDESNTSHNDGRSGMTGIANRNPPQKTLQPSAPASTQDLMVKPDSVPEAKPKVPVYDLSFPTDYDCKKILALKAMRKRPEEPEIRIPTNSWAGYGLSHSMPANVKKLENLGFEQNGSPSTDGAKSVDKDPWKDSPGHLTTRTEVNCTRNTYEGSLGRSNYIDSASLPLRSSFSIGKYTDLADLFNDMGFSKYIQVFEKQEIDLETFMTLTEQDLKDLGISQFGIRRKMYCAITRLNQYSSAFSPAPGAERKQNCIFKPHL